MRPPCPPGHIPAQESCGGGTRTRTLSHTRRALWSPFELRRKDGPGGTRTLTRSLQDFYAAFTSPALGGVINDEKEHARRLLLSLITCHSRNCGGGNRTRGLGFMRPLLCH